MPEVTIKEGGPLHDLFFAINHYVSTGEDAGAGIALEDIARPELLLLMLGEDTANPVDRADFAKFVARAHEIIKGGPVDGLVGVFTDHGTSDAEGMGCAPDASGEGGRFHLVSLDILREDVPAWTLALLSWPGAGGWGSRKAGLDARYPGQRKRLIATIGESG